MMPVNQTSATENTMTTLSVPTNSVDPAGRESHEPGWRRLAGAGGLAFAATVIIQNALRAGFPSNDAAPQRVIEYYAHHHGVTLALAALFPIGALGLAVFVSGVVGDVVPRVVGRPAGRLPGLAGALGATGIIANFTAMIALDLALAGYIHRGSPDAAVVEGLWLAHNAVFGVLLTSIGVALAGLGTAAARVGLIGRRWQPAVLVGAALLVVASATTPAILEGGPTFFVGVAGFVVWVVFVIRTSVALLRRG
jgi:hypothetical protein